MVQSYTLVPSLTTVYKTYYTTNRTFNIIIPTRIDHQYLFDWSHVLTIKSNTTVRKIT